MVKEIEIFSITHVLWKTEFFHMKMLRSIQLPSNSTYETGMF